MGSKVPPIPIDSLNPVTRFLLLSFLPLTILGANAAPLFIAFAIYIYPWRHAHLNFTAFLWWGRMALLVSLIFVLNEVVGGCASRSTLTSALRLFVSICMLVLAEMRYRRALTASDLLHVASYCGGHRRIVVPLIAVHRFHDVMARSAKEIVDGGRGRRLLMPFRGTDFSIRVAVGYLCTFFGEFFEYASRLTLAIELRLGTSGPIVITKYEGFTWKDMTVVGCVGALVAWALAPSTGGFLGLAVIR